jgi:hypothetical protein
LFIERASGQVVYDFFKARRHMLDATARSGRTPNHSRAAA